MEIHDDRVADVMNVIFNQKKPSLHQEWSARTTKSVIAIVVQMTFVLECGLCIHIVYSYETFLWL